ncbi:putative fimV C-domain protein [Burkholderia pseudomallei]|nr:putative fimV C-domain protein [Burkholderia pseudomallei]CAJ6603490.1 putative fimV C-domain protein [Burkholderia pseudomallei]CAJ6714736.1 putative fimV C-domain protein [Burkholderia pseudomallei]CAJ8195990.1 putative fimV C-domain protein [Burkholderia pseudomallei]CAK0293303.1 putative fimV C-domain protein [Burkholderia pseudomallei]
MTPRLLSSTTIFDGLPRARRAVALAVLALAGASAAYAAPDAASAASAEQAAPLTITVRPGQSLNDIAVAVTQSHDPGVLARAGRALFDANPQAFMKRDPSRLKIGAQLMVPALDATGGAAASGATAASAAASAASTSAVTGAAPHPSASASAPAAASRPAAASGASHAATASGAAAFAASGVAAGSASGANGASAPGVSAPGAASAHAPSAVAPAAPVASSGAGSAHVWSGSIQQAPAGANGASAAGAEALLAPGAANRAPSGSGAQAAGASQARPSSLQQLLALKNRVLMELQKHGIGKPAANVAPAPAAGSAQKPQASAAAGAAASATAAATTASETIASDAAAGSAASATPASAAPAASMPAAAPRVSAPAHAAAPQAPFNTGAAVAIGAALAALIVGFALRRRKKGASADAIEPGAFTPAPALDPDAAAAIADAPAGPEAAEDARHDEAEPDKAAAARRASSAAPLAEAKRPPAQHGSEPPSADEDAAPAREPQAPAAQPLTLKTPRPDEQGGAPQSAGDEPSGAKPAPYAWRQAFPSDAIAALDSLDMPLPPREAGATADRPEQSQHAEPAGSRGAQSATNGLSATPPPMRAENAREGQTHGEAGSATDFEGAGSFDNDARVAPQRPEGATPRPVTAPDAMGRDEAAARAAESSPTESTRDAPLTPGAPAAESRLSTVGAGAAHSPMPDAAAAAEATAPHAATPPDAAPHDDGQTQAAPRPLDGGPQPPAAARHEAAPAHAEIPNAPLAPAAPAWAAPQPPGMSFAEPAQAEPGDVPAAPDRAPAANPPPLGVAQFGALNLDFDLELPSGPSASLPAFTPEALAKIARNKLELASEYVELGDLAGARTLLHEVIEADHADTRDEARVMLAKLADLS